MAKFFSQGSNQKTDTPAQNGLIDLHQPVTSVPPQQRPRKFSPGSKIARGHLLLLSNQGGVHDACAKSLWCMMSLKRELAVSALSAADLEAVGFDDPMTALAAIEADTRVRVLVARVDFGSGMLNGAALGRMLIYKRPAVRSVFLARPENHIHTGGDIDFVPMPSDAPILIEKVAGLLAAQIGSYMHGRCQGRVAGSGSSRGWLRAETPMGIRL